MITSLFLKLLILRRYFNNHLALNISMGIIIGSLIFQYQLFGLILLLFWCGINFRLSLILLVFSVVFGFYYSQIYIKTIIFQNKSYTALDSVELVVASAPVQKEFGTEAIVKLKGVKGNALAIFPKYSKVSIGDNIKANIKFLEINFDDSYGKFLMSQKIFNKLEVNRFEITDSKTSLSSIGFRISKKFTESSSMYLNEPYLSLFNGITIGKDNFSKDYSQKITASGLSHILAVSGFNLLLSFNILLRLSGKFNRKKLTITSCLFIFSYLLVVGLNNLTALRAFIVIVLFLISSIYGRKSTQQSILAYSLVLLILIYPYYLSNISIQLSISAALGIIYFKEPLSSRLHHLIKNSVLLDLIATSLAAYFATLPVIHLAFQESSVAGLITNILVLPLIPFITIYGILTEILSLAGIEPLNRFMFIIIYPFIYYIDLIIHGSFELGLPNLKGLGLLLPYLLLFTYLIIVKSKNE